MKLLVVVVSSVNDPPAPNAVALVPVTVNPNAGVFTATEAGAVAAVYALFLTMVIYKEIKLSDLPELLWETCLTNAALPAPSTHLALCSRHAPDFQAFRISSMDGSCEGRSGFWPFR